MGMVGVQILYFTSNLRRLQSRSQEFLELTPILLQMVLGGRSLLKGIQEKNEDETRI